MGLAVYQGVSVPAAGLAAAAWLALGLVLFLLLFARRARVADAASAALDPELVRLRGRCPLVLAPMANPQSARSLVAVAAALAPPGAGRVLTLAVVVAPRGWRPEDDPTPWRRAQSVLGEALAAGAAADAFPEALATVAPEPWSEIARVAKEHRCESVLLGYSQLASQAGGAPLESLISSLDCDIVVLRAPPGWRLDAVCKILVPVRGRGAHEELLARLLGSLARSAPRQIRLLTVLETSPGPDRLRLVRRELRRRAADLCPRPPAVDVLVDPEPPAAVAREADRSDLVILGLQRAGRRRKLIGRFVHDVASRTACPLLVISRRG